MPEKKSHILSYCHIVHTNVVSRVRFVLKITLLPLKAYYRKKRKIRGFVCYIISRSEEAGGIAMSNGSVTTIPHQDFAISFGKTVAKARKETDFSTKT